MSELPVSLSDIENWIREYQESREKNQELVDYYWQKFENASLAYDECVQYVADVEYTRKELDDEMDIYKREAEKSQRRLDNDIELLKILYESRKKFSNGRRR